jgi:hypothetical protein
VKYSEIMSSILSEDARSKTLIQNSASEAYIVQSTGDRPQHRGRSSSCRPNATRKRSLEIYEYATIARNLDILRPTAEPSKRRTKNFTRRAIVRRR